MRQKDQLMPLPPCRRAPICLLQWPIGRRGQQQPHVCWHAQPPHTPLCQPEGLHQPPLHWWVPGEHLGSSCVLNTPSRGMTASVHLSAQQCCSKALPLVTVHPPPAGTPHSGAAEGGASGTPASTGIKLAEKLHQGERRGWMQQASVCAGIGT